MIWGTKEKGAKKRERKSMVFYHTSLGFQEFLMAIDVTSAGTPREKLLWAFRFNFQNFIPVIFVEDLGFEKLICIEQNSKGMPSTN